MKTDHKGFDDCFVQTLHPDSFDRQRSVDNLLCNISEVNSAFYPVVLHLIPGMEWLGAPECLPAMKRLFRRSGAACGYHSKPQPNPGSAGGKCPRKRKQEKALSGRVGERD
ncbi:hypothetical protein LSTR_LSTR012387 [Laodelphax striatellus]|uniref:Uncharacterized protein n=1 Tax=Laodelphax striatellus TaxID=195883 RepID=A0A482XKI5_LAOST|nr:hypothetical protein LSTR_LSTR012387 [Laodelphax striatellus]